MLLTAQLHSYIIIFYIIIINKEKEINIGFEKPTEFQGSGL